MEDLRFIIRLILVLLLVEHLLSIWSNILCRFSCHLPICKEGTYLWTFDDIYGNREQRMGGNPYSICILIDIDLCDWMGRDWVDCVVPFTDKYWLYRLVKEII